MFDILLNAVRLIISDDVRKSTSAILDLIRRSPEWERDICTLEAKIGLPFAEQATLLSELTASKMIKLNYPLKTIQSFRSSYFELITNALEHGCRTNKETIRIIIDVTTAYVALRVLNPRRSKFDPYSIINENRTLLNSNPTLKKGRGLLLVSEHADTFEAIDNNRGIKAVFYRNAVSFNIEVLKDLTIIEITDGLGNPSLKRRLKAIALLHPNNDLILDFSGLREIFIHTSESYEIILELHDLYAVSNKQIMALIPRSGEIILPDFLVAYSWEEILEKMSKHNLLPKVKKLIDKRDS